MVKRRHWAERDRGKGRIHLRRGIPAGEKPAISVVEVGVLCSNRKKVDKTKRYRGGRIKNEEGENPSRWRSWPIGGEGGASFSVPRKER